MGFSVQCKQEVAYEVVEMVCICIQSLGYRISEGRHPARPAARQHQECIKRWKKGTRVKVNTILFQHN